MSLTVSQLLERQQGGTLFGGGGSIPPIPSKRQAVHITDMRTYMLCRRQWDWTSVLRQGLQPSMLPSPLFIGQGVHIGLEYGYRASLAAGGDPMEFSLHDALKAFNKWSKQRLQALEEVAGNLWEDEAEQYAADTHMGRVLLTHYSLWFPRRDERFRLLGLENMFSTDVPGSRTVNYDGRFDGLVEDRKSGNLYILEFKTAAHTTDQKLASVFRDMQPIAYSWAASRVYGRPVKGVLYRVLWKKIPSEVTITSRGEFSRDKRQHISEEWLDYILDSMASQVGDASAEDFKSARADLNQMSRGLRQMIREKEERFLYQKIFNCSPQAIEEVLRVLQVVGGEMVDPSTPTFPMPGYHCAFCRFKTPCDLLAHGYPELAADVIDAEYAPRTYWEDWDDA